MKPHPKLFYGCPSDIQSGRALHSLKRGGTELARGLFFLDAYVLFGGFGRDGCGGLGLRGVVLLYVSGGSGDSPPCLATTDADEHGGHDYRTKQNNCP